MSNPLIFMTSVAGKPTESKICEYLNSLKNNGIEQIMIYPRSGCEIKYLSEEWFQIVGYFLKYAKELEMKIWLYDDFNWPSGDAAGRVTEIPEYRAKSIVIVGDNRGTIDSKSGDDLYFDESYFSDLMCDDAVEYFIKCTHEKYYEKFAQYFGNVIVGIFTDEPAVGYSCKNDSIPYYDEMPRDYQKECGRDFYEDIKNLYPELSRICMKIIAKRFGECYLDRLKKWCDDHKILMTGHLMNDTTPFRSVKSSGNLLQNLSRFALPGIDEINTNLKSGWLQTLLGATQYAANENGAMAELFALGPCELTYTTKNCMMFMAACFKVDHYFLAISHMDLRGNMKITDFFNNFADDQPDFAGIKLLAQNVKIAARYAKQDFKPDVYIRYPTEVCAKHIIDGIEDYPLALLTNKLAFYQLQWKFITQNEQPCDAPIIEFNDSFEYCLGELVTADVEEICSQFDKNIIVYDKTGAIPSGLFVRKYDNGDYIVINLSGESDIYNIDGVDYYLDKHGVFIKGVSEKQFLSGERKELNIDFKINYLNPNITRSLYSPTNETTIVCDDNTDIVMAIRNGEKVYLNGNEVGPIYSKTCLSNGFSELYSDSATLKLYKGVNSLRAQNDFAFMPTVFLIGDFVTNFDKQNIHSVAISKRPDSLSVGDNLEYFGTVEFETQLDIPDGAKAIELVGTQLYTSVYINDNLLQDKITGPYIYNFDSNLWGTKISLKIVQRSSMASMFGDSDNFPRKRELSHKRLNDNFIRFGFDKINLVF